MHLFTENGVLHIETAHPKRKCNQFLGMYNVQNMFMWCTQKNVPLLCNILLSEMSSQQRRFNFSKTSWKGFRLGEKWKIDSSFQKYNKTAFSET
jgi:hypothetical protein